jgi:ankyrin repeat protein
VSVAVFANVFVEAIHSGETFQQCSCPSADASVTEPSPEIFVSKTRIIESVKHLDLQSTRTLLDARPSLLTVTDRQGRNLLHLACSVSCDKLGVPESVSARLVNFLLDRGLDIESPVGRDACTVLFFAVARGRNPTLVKLLIKRGAKPTSAPGGGLFAAGWWEDIEILKLLMQAGSPIDIVVGITPFLACWCWKRFDAAKFLAVNGANVNHKDSKGKTALHHGVEKEFDPVLLKWLVKHGASPDIQDRDGVSPRRKASRKRDKRFVAAFA